MAVFAYKVVKGLRSDGFYQDEEKLEEEYYDYRRGHGVAIMRQLGRVLFGSCFESLDLAHDRSLQEGLGVRTGSLRFTVELRACMSGV
jgi:hypothetical protein